MSYNPKLVSARSIAHLLPLAITIAVLGGASAAAAQDVIQVQEDWELIVGSPDQLVCGPQVITTISPFSDVRGTHFTLEINHRSLPYWTPGGLTMHQWNGENRIQSYDRADRTVMSTANESLTWTQKLYIESGNKLVFEVVDGHSSTWGDFGFSGLFKVKADWSTHDLNNYSPAVSVAESGVPYAGNRVQSLILKEVRLSLSDGGVITDNTPRVAHLLIE